MAAGQIILQDSVRISSHLTAALVCLDSAWVALVESHPAQIEDLLQETDEIVLLLQDARSSAAGSGRSPVVHFPEGCAPVWSRTQLLLLAHRLLALSLLLRHTAQNLVLLDHSRQAKRALYPQVQYAPAHHVAAHHGHVHHVPTQHFSPHHAPVGGHTQWLR